MKWKQLAPKTAKRGEVEWQDIVMIDNWNEDDDPMTRDVLTVGFVLLQSASTVIIACSYNYTDETWATIHAIPAGAVTAVRIYGND